jgi:hypothetical protein
LRKDIGSIEDDFYEVALGDSAVEHSNQTQQQAILDSLLILPLEKALSKQLTVAHPSLCDTLTKIVSTAVNRKH